VFSFSLVGFLLFILLVYLDYASTLSNKIDLLIKKLFGLCLISLKKMELVCNHRALVAIIEK
jgi:hypothetical protein